MMWKILIVAILAVGALAEEYKVSDEQSQQLRSMLSAYCKKNGAEDKVAEVEQAIKDFVECGKGLINPEVVKQEIEEAKPNGALDEVFKKYCNKSPELKTCIHTLTTKIAPCLEASLKEHINGFNNATDQLIDFVCYKDGDRIALFIAEGGPECFALKANPIRECAEKVRGKVSTVDEAKKLSLAEQCTKFDELSVCVVNALETCSTPTPGNMAESMFKFVRKGSPCGEKQ